jgi:hypothetical protein
MISICHDGSTINPLKTNDFFINSILATPFSSPPGSTQWLFSKRIAESKFLAIRLPSAASKFLTVKKEYFTP